jgi:hypothetical protein
MPVLFEATQFQNADSGAVAVFGGSGCSGSACGLQNAKTAQNGVAAVSDVYANDQQGAFKVAAWSPGAAAPAVFELSVSGDTPYNLSPDLSTTPQSAQSGQPFALPLQVQLADASGVPPIEGTPITFQIGTAQSSDGNGRDANHPACAGDASASFQGHGGQYTGLADASGVVTSPPLVANSSAGCYYFVTASVDLSYASSPEHNYDGSYHPAVFQLWNLPGRPGKILAVASTTPQVVVSSTSGNANTFGSLKARAFNSTGNPAPSGTGVTFSSPSTPNSGDPSANFGGSSCAGATCHMEMTTTNNAGVATVSNAYENGSQGTYEVSAWAQGDATPAIFNLSNGLDAWTLSPAAGTTPQHAETGATFSQAPSAVLTDSSGGPVAHIPVRFQIWTPQYDDAGCNDGASATFQDGGVQFPTSTNNLGVATAPSVVANSSISAANCYYFVTANVDWSYTSGGVSNGDGSIAPAVFQFTNTIPPPQAISPPSISGPPRVGQTLTESHAQWANNPSSYRYQWDDCDRAGSNCSHIGGATSQSYRVVKSDIGHEIRVEETAINSAGSYTAKSAAVGPVPPPIPTIVTRPLISGKAQDGQTLTESHGVWANSPTRYQYQWEDCDNTGSSCTAIGGAAGRTYTLGDLDVGHTIRVQEVASNAGGPSVPAASDATSVVGSAIPVNSRPPYLSGIASKGKTLLEHHGTWSGHPNNYRYQWRRCDSSGGSCVSIPGATSRTYVLLKSDVQHTIVVRESACNDSGCSKWARSKASPVVSSGSPPPVEVSPPTISGQAILGQTLTESHGRWANKPVSYAYQWEDCSLTGKDCSSIQFATAQTYKLKTSDAGHTIRVQETASNSGGTSKPATSAAVGPVFAYPVLKYLGPTSVKRGRKAVLRARFTSVTGLAGRSLGFTLGEGSTKQTCQGVTDSNGVGSCSIGTVTVSKGDQTVKVDFSGDRTDAPDSVTATVKVT